MSPSRLIIADDHQVVRQGLRAIIEQTTDMMVLAEATDGAEAERLAREIPAELLILDISLPAKRGGQVLESLRASGIGLPVLFFSMHPASQYLTYARRHGAQGFVGKDASSDQLLRAIRRIVGGGTHFPSSGDSSPTTNTLFSALSRREAEVCRGLVRGEPLATIANRLGVNAKSVSTYRRRILDKLGLNTNADLIALATHRGEY